MLKSIRSDRFLFFSIQFRWSIEHDQSAADNADEDPLDILDQLPQAQVQCYDDNAVLLD